MDWFRLLLTIVRTRVERVSDEVSSSGESVYVRVTNSNECDCVAIEHTVVGSSCKWKEGTKREGKRKEGVKEHRRKEGRKTV